MAPGHGLFGAAGEAPSAALPALGARGALGPWAGAATPSPQNSPERPPSVRLGVDIQRTCIINS